MYSILLFLNFFLSLAILMWVARRSIWLGFLAGSCYLGLFTLTFGEFIRALSLTFLDPSILLLSLAVGIIPMIGGILEAGGLMNNLVKSLSISRKLFVGLSPAALGLLPMPGGALLSAPLVDRAGDDISPDLRAAANVWFRHLLILVYPLGTLLATTKMADVNLYSTVVYTIPFFIIMLVCGYALLLRRIPGFMPGTNPLQMKHLILPVVIIISAPLLHVILTLLVPEITSEAHLLIAVGLSFTAGYAAVRRNGVQIRKVFSDVHPWRYMLLILGVFLYMHVFQQTPVVSLISESGGQPWVFILLVGPLLAAATGRVNLPVAVLVPILVKLPGFTGFTPGKFALIHFFTFLGYVSSPVHPCILVSVQYFKTSYLSTLKNILLPTLISLFFAGLFIFIY